MTAKFKQVSASASRKSSIKNAGAADGIRKTDERVDSTLLSPFALMALGLTGAVTAAVPRDQAGAAPSQDSGSDPVMGKKLLWGPLRAMLLDNFKWRLINIAFSRDRVFGRVGPRADKG